MKEHVRGEGIVLRDAAGRLQTFGLRTQRPLSGSQTSANTVLRYKDKSDKAIREMPAVGVQHVDEHLERTQCLRVAVALLESRGWVSQVWVCLRWVGLNNTGRS